ncbi:LysR family transcriptional regulator [Halotalea alkalilenta]|uniref:LysR family transcriptional regulator n=1 Tax=Halotalea alkalilenta TaxID=376489 RepID=UPI000487284B|nr:LysR family transcriptional regulator [Halotalea alkalilenta]
MDTRSLQETALRYFLEVVKHGSINRASAQLNVAPSAISRQISRLEQDLGARLFERRAKGMVPSGAGELLATHVRRERLEAQRLMEEIAALEARQIGRIRLASVEGMSIDFLPHLVRLFLADHPGVNVDLHSCAVEEVTRLVSEGEVDIGFTNNHRPRREVRVEARAAAPIHALVARDHPLASRERLALSDIVDYPLALPHGHTSVRQLFDLACARQGVLFEPVFTSNYLNALIHFALDGGGIALCAELTVRHRTDAERYRVIPIDETELGARFIEILTLAGRTLPAGVAAFVELARASFSAAAPRAG